MTLSGLVPGSPLAPNGGNAHDFTLSSFLSFRSLRMEPVVGEIDYQVSQDVLVNVRPRNFKRVAD